MEQHYYDSKAKARLDRMVAHLPNTEDLSLIALKGHLLAEEFLSDLLLAKAVEPEVMKGIDLGFYKKARLIRALYGGQDSSHIWPALDALNGLRNELAHLLESDKVEQKREKFVSLMAVMAPAVRGRSKAFELRDGIAVLLGCLISYELTALTGAPPPHIDLAAL